MYIIMSETFIKITYIHTYTSFMLEIYRVAVELMYSRNSRFTSTPRNFKTNLSYEAVKNPLYNISLF